MTDLFLIKKPIVTEKSTDLNKMGKYVFLVKDKATSAEIKKLVKKIYGVDAVKVNVINVKPKFGVYGRVRTSKRKGYKKAVITVKTGQSIDLGA